MTPDVDTAVVQNRFARSSITSVSFTEPLNSLFFASSSGRRMRHYFPRSIFVSSTFLYPRDPLSFSDLNLQASSRRGPMPGARLRGSERCQRVSASLPPPQATSCPTRYRPTASSPWRSPIQRRPLAGGHRSPPRPSCTACPSSPWSTPRPPPLPQRPPQPPPQPPPPIGTRCWPTTCRWWRRRSTSRPPPTGRGGLRLLRRSGVYDPLVVGRPRRWGAATRCVRGGWTDREEHGAARHRTTPGSCS